MSLDQLNADARTVTAALPAEVRGPWMHFVSALLRILADYEARDAAQTESVRSLRSDLTGLIYESIREYGAGLDADRAAIMQDLAVLKAGQDEVAAAQSTAADDRRVMIALMGATAEAVGVKLDALPPPPQVKAAVAPAIRPVPPIPPPGHDDPDEDHP